MPFSSLHTDWFKDTGINLKTKDGRKVEVLEFSHNEDEAVLEAWAKHFRNHYCFDSEIDELRKGVSLSRKDYLDTMVFPDATEKPGPSIRAGDFSEILVSDFLEYLQGYWIPRDKYRNKPTRNESIKGTDIIGFKIFEEDSFSPKDVLAVFESKAQFSGTKGKSRLQDAINDSSKDILRKGETLNFLKRKFLCVGKEREAAIVTRFQNEEDNPYQQVYGAVALFEGSLMDSTLISSTDASAHPRLNSLRLIVFKGDDMMNLVHKLYRKAADEA